MRPENKIYCGDWMDNGLLEKSIQLIIADPPYFEIKGEFDFAWESFADYLKDVERWAAECKRVLADNGTLFWWGHAKRIAYSQIIFDRYFNLENNIAVEFNRQTMKGFAGFNCFAPVSERLLMYSNEVIRTGLETIKLDINNFAGLRRYFKDLQEWIGRSSAEISATLGHGKADHCFRHSSTQWDLPTAETYAELIKVFKIDRWEGFREYESSRLEYESSRLEYESLRRPFDNVMGLYDVMRFDQESHISKWYNHDTCKPEKLSRALILTCSRANDLVLVPFAGSGTECAMCAKEGRRFIGFDIEPKYAEMANARVKRVNAAPDMFKVSGEESGMKTGINSAVRGERRAYAGN